MCDRGDAAGRDSARIRAIELIAFGISTAFDVAQLLGTKNPLTTNYVQWLTLARRIAVEAHERAESITDVVVADLDANQMMLNHGWNLLVGSQEKPDVI